MSVYESITKIQEQGDGVKHTFEFPFAIYEQSDIKVYRVDREDPEQQTLLLQTLGEDYTVEFTSGKENTGSVSYIKYNHDISEYEPAPILDTEDSFILTAVPLTQPVSLPVRGRFREDQIESMGDRLTRMIQQLAEEVSRTIKTSALEDGWDITWDNIVEAMRRAEDAADRAELIGGFSLATQEEAEAGTDNTKVMSPLRTKQAISVNVVMASEAEAIAGTSNVRVMSPLRVKQSIAENTPGADVAVDNVTIEKGGDDKLQVKNGGISAAKVASAAISQAKLKTATGEVSVGHALATRTFPGGEYGFYPRIKMSNTSNANWRARFLRETSFAGWTSYTTVITLSSDGGTIYANQRYITSSGKDHWIFLLVDKETKQIVGGYQAPDHPSYGNGGDETKLSHPFGEYDKDKQEIVLADNAILHQLSPLITREKSLLTLVNERCIIDDTKRPGFTPREIIEIDEYGDLRGVVIQKGKTPNWAKIKLIGDEYELKRRMVERLPNHILYKALVLKGG